MAAKTPAQRKATRKAAKSRTKRLAQGELDRGRPGGVQAAGVARASGVDIKTTSPAQERAVQQAAIKHTEELRRQRINKPG